MPAVITRVYYNRLGYGYWLELIGNLDDATLDYNRLGYGYWLELKQKYNKRIHVLQQIKGGIG